MPGRNNALPFKLQSHASHRVQFLYSKSPGVVPIHPLLETRMGGGEWMAQGSKTTGNLELTKGFEEIVHSTALAL